MTLPMPVELQEQLSRPVHPLEWVQVPGLGHTKSLPQKFTLKQEVVSPSSSSINTLDCSAFFSWDTNFDFAQGQQELP